MIETDLVSAPGKTLRTGLEFAPGTTDECKRLIAQLVKPGDIFGAYRSARFHFGTGDLVLTISEQDPSEFEAESRLTYLKRMQEARGLKGVPLLMRRMAAQSAHGVVQLPFEADAMWLIVVRGMQAVPIMCVIFTTPYEVTGAN
jgi:hypothetical protein